MTRAAIVESLAKEFSEQPEAVRRVLEMLDAGLTAPHIGRFRREDMNLSENHVRRLARRRERLEELDRRRATILRMLTGTKDGEEIADDDSFPEIRACMHRFELEDLFLPHRRPEPEVQLALDRGLGDLADRIVAPIPRPKKARSKDKAAAEDQSEEEAKDEAGGENEEEPPSSDGAASGATVGDDGESAPPQQTQEQAATGDEPGTEQPEVAVPVTKKEEPDVPIKLARLCNEFVNPDRGVHTEQEALTGALRILSDRLGRDSDLRRAVRKALNKHGVLTVRPTGDESKAHRHKALLKTKEPIRQIQNRKLLRLRQAQKDRVITTTITLDPEVILPRVRQALGRNLDPEFDAPLAALCRQALAHRLIPTIEADVRLELKERADEEALRFLSQHLRQVLYTPVGGRRPVVGLAANAKQDWILVMLDQDGQPSSAEIKIETGDKDVMKLAEELREALRDSGARAIAVGNSKSAMTQLPRVRECVRLLEAGADVFIVNEAGLTSYANSELARKELADLSVPARMAVSLGRRYQDFLLEVLKVDPRSLGLGMETGLVSKANLRRVLQETVESVVAQIGAEVQAASIAFLRRLPGLDNATVTKLVERRESEPFQSREDLRASGVLNEAQWVNTVACLRVRGSSEPLDRTSLHPHQYPLARRLIEAAGGSIEETLGARGATKGLRRADFEVDEATWRDLVREISHPGRDPRLRLFPARSLAHDTDPTTLEKDQIIEGTVTSLTSFGAFVDMGIEREGLIHIREASNRYVHDTREILSIGQVVRARLVDTAGQRITLSLKNVPPPERKHSGGTRGPRREREGKKEGWPELNRPVRAAQTRRDGLGASSKRREGGGKGGRPGGGRGGPGKVGAGGSRRGGRRGGRDEEYDPQAVREATSTDVQYNPFATFFDGGDEAGGDVQASEDAPAPVENQDLAKDKTAPETPVAAEDKTAPETPVAAEDKTAPETPVAAEDEAAADGAGSAGADEDRVAATEQE